MGYMLWLAPPKVVNLARRATTEEQGAIFHLNMERLLSKVPWSELSDLLSKKYTGQLSYLRSLLDDSNYSLLWRKMANFKALAIF